MSIAYIFFIYINLSHFIVNYAIYLLRLHPVNHKLPRMALAVDIIIDKRDFINNVLFMKKAYQHRTLLILSFALLFSPQWLFSVQLPVYLNWRSSNNYFYTKIFTDVTTGHQDLYRINLGLDTLFTNGIRTQVEITNQESKLNSQVVFDHAIIGYYNDYGTLQVSMQNFGYGKGFFLNNRRNDHPYYNENTLLNYKWYGLNPSFKLNDSEIGLGMAGNNFNEFMGDVNYKLKKEPINLELFGFYANNDNQYTLDILHLGYLMTYHNQLLKYHSGFVYNIIPKSNFLHQMEGWHLINEVRIKPLDYASLILSTEHQTQIDKKKTDYQYELCIDGYYQKAQCYAGINLKSLPNEEAVTYFVDGNYTLVRDFTLGMFFDFVTMTKSDNYYKFGIQTKYSLK